MSNETFVKEQEVEVLFVAPDKISSGEEQPRSEWSSLENEALPDNKKMCEKCLHSPISVDICNDYISLSDSSIFRHPYYNYPAVIDPGIEHALLGSEPPIIYPDDGQELYLHLCSEMNLSPVRMFYNNLLNPVNSVKYYGVNPRGVQAMARALQNNKFVTCFDMTDNFLNDDACYHLGQMLKSNTTLQELILDGCRIGVSGLLRLGENLYLNHTLVSLNLTRNEIGDEGGVVFAKQVHTGISVQKVNLSKNSLGRETALALVDGLEWQNPFTHLDLSWNNFNHVPSTVKMIDQLAKGELVQELNFSYNSLEGDRVAGALYNLLRLPKLKFLDLSHNRLQGEALELFTSGLVRAKKLITLNLSYNPMTPEDAYNTLQKMWKPQIKLQQLLMENISVEKPFVVLLDKLSTMKYRKKMVVKYGYVLQNWTVEWPDPRGLLLKRADFLCNLNKRHRVDIAQFLLQFKKEYKNPVPLNTFIDRCDQENIPLNEDFINELSYAFPGPKTKKSRTIDLNLISEFMERIWPDRKLPPTPPPEPEPEPELEPEVPNIAPRPKKRTGKK